MSGVFSHKNGTLSLGTDSLSLSGDFYNSDTILSTTGNVVITGLQSDHKLQGSGYTERLKLNTIRNSYLTGKLNIGKLLTFGKGNLFATPTDTVILASTAFVTGEGPQSHLQGQIKMSKYLGTDSSSFGGLGFILGQGAENLGTVTLLRTSGPAVNLDPSGTGLGAVNRSYEVSISGTQPASGRPLTLKWLNSEDNNLDSTHVYVYRRNAMGMPWQILNTQPINALVSGQTGQRKASVNTNHFSTFSFTGSPSPLPVTLLYLNGTYTPGKVLLTWATATEQNNAKFNVERSPDGKTFTRAGSVPGAGTTYNPQSYSFTDAPVFLKPADVMYYRLVQEDFNGKLSPSAPLAVSAPEKTGGLISVSPNPFTRRLVAESVSAGALLSLELSDMAGKLLYVANPKGGIPEGQSLTMESSELQNLPAGAYTLRVYTQQSVQTFRVVKQH